MTETIILYGCRRNGNNGYNYEDTNGVEQSRVDQSRVQYHDSSGAAGGSRLGRRQWYGPWNTAEGPGAGYWLLRPAGGEALVSESRVRRYEDKRSTVTSAQHRLTQLTTSHRRTQYVDLLPPPACIHYHRRYRNRTTYTETTTITHQIRETVFFLNCRSYEI